jgi:hypothetical protein
MSAEQDAVDVQEYVLRRIHKSNYDAQLRVAVKPVAFKPTESDEDGISVYRERFVAPAEVAAAGRTPGAYYVARLAVEALQALGITVVPTPGDLHGHAVLAELNRPFHEKEKQRSRELQLKLAELASQAIVYQPLP